MLLGLEESLPFLVPGPDYYSGNLGAIIHFDFQTLKKATNNFHPNNQLGRGGFGPVYQVIMEETQWSVIKSSYLCLLNFWLDEF